MRSDLFHNVRFYILLSSLIVSFAIPVFIFINIPPGTLQTIRLTQFYALTAVVLLYLSLLIGPVIFVFKTLPYSGQIIKARRAIGVSSCYFALLHGTFALFGQLGGLNGLGFLSQTYVIALSFSFCSLIILLVLTLTSTKAAIKYLSFPKWKILHRLVYIAGIFTIIHALLLGSHFSDLSNTIPVVFFILLFVLIFFESMRVDAWINKKTGLQHTFGLTVLCTTTISGIIVFAMITKQIPKLGIHGEHQTNLSNTSSGESRMASMPGMSGDKNRRYTVSFSHPDTIEVNQPVPLGFTVYDASSGHQIVLFETPFIKMFHLIIVDENLEYFSHIHPEFDPEKGFFITTKFPHDGIYHVYTDFQPFNAVEQQIAFTIKVGNTELQREKPVFETARERTFGDFVVNLKTLDPLRAADMSIGKSEFVFSIKQKNTNEPVTTLAPYLGAFGHLLMINTLTFEYIHAHPKINPLEGLSKGGPEVVFVPVGLYGSIRPGTYRIFAEFRPDGNTLISDFVVTVE